MINLRFIASDTVSLLLITGVWAVVFKKLVVLLSLVKYGMTVIFFLYQILQFCLPCFLLRPRTITKSASLNMLLLIGVYLATEKGCFLFLFFNVLIKETVGFS